MYHNTYMWNLKKTKLGDKEYFPGAEGWGKWEMLVKEYKFAVISFVI